MIRTALPSWRRPLAVVAHPDDESFGLGAVLTRFVADGAQPAVLCFTHGEASTLHGVDGDLAVVRAAELEEAARILNVGSVTLLTYPDGALALSGTSGLAAEIAAAAAIWDADGLLVFDPAGITGHPDHVAATEAARAAAGKIGLEVLAWTLPDVVAAALNAELDAGFVGASDEDIDLVVRVDRAQQLQAVQAHPSQAVPGSALWRRLELLGDREHLRYLPAGARTL